MLASARTPWAARRLAQRGVSRDSSVRLHRESLAILRDSGAPIDVHPEVEDALEHGRPVVALESTIITHGMPYPTSLEMARSVKRIVRSTGSTPATIAVINGRVKIGLSPAELERIAACATDPVKVSRRDIGPTLALGRDGGTTCSSTLIFAAMAGIKVFATGGLGGVHRGGEKTMDVSADLHELTRCPVGLVSAGVKSILDIGRTLEYLETLGVPVISYAKTNDFPAFYTRKSGHQVPWHVDDPREAARILYTQWKLGMTNGALFAVPIPEEHDATGAAIQEAVELAIREAEESGASKLGKAVTPWLLKRVGELTRGASLDSNVALVENTALVGGQIASEYAKLVQNGSQDHKGRQAFTFGHNVTDRMVHSTTNGTHVINAEAGIECQKASIVVVGCAAMDITSTIRPVSDTSQNTTYPGTLSLTPGGVGRNIAEAAHRLSVGLQGHDTTTLLVAPVGDDVFGKLLVDLTGSAGMRTDGLVFVPGQRSAVCNLLLDPEGGLKGGVADMDLPQLWKATEVIPILRDHRPRFLALDGNLSIEALTAIVTEVANSDVQTFFEPTSVAKSTRVLPAIAANLHHSTRPVISYVSPNLLELRHLYEEARTTFDLTSHDYWWKVIDSFALDATFRRELDQLAKRPVADDALDLGTLSFLIRDGLIQMAVHLLPFFQHLVVKCGRFGVLVVMRIRKADAGSWSTEQSNPRQRCIVKHSNDSGEVIIVRHFPPLSVPPDTMVNTTGAGDSLVGALLATLARKPDSFLNPSALESMIDVAQKAAVLTLQSPRAVSPSMSSLCDS